MRLRLLLGGLLIASGLAPTVSSASECTAPSQSVRVMLHDSDVLAGRLRVATSAGRSPKAQAAALRTLFEAAGCAQLTSLGGESRPDVMCSVPGATDRSVIVAVNYRYGSAASAALLPSLAEALAVAPRRHTYQWIAFAPHETREDRTQATQKPKGAMRLLDGMPREERDRVDAMIHIGPMGYGSIAQHPVGAEERLACSLESAAQAAALEFSRAASPTPGCVDEGAMVTGSFLDGDCSARLDWTGGNDWLPFRRARIPVFGVHSGGTTKRGGKIEPELYVKSYRMLAIFLALADDALAAPPPAQGGAAASE